MGACQNCCHRQADDLYVEQSLERESRPNTPMMIVKSPSNTVVREIDGKPSLRSEMSPPQKTGPNHKLLEFATSCDKSDFNSGSKGKPSEQEIKLLDINGDLEVRHSMTDSDVLLQTPNKNLTLESTVFFQDKSLREIADLKVKAYLSQVQNWNSVNLKANKFYQGEVKDGLPWGRGVLKVSSSDIYLGIFRNERAMYKVEHFSFYKDIHFLGLVDNEFRYHGFGTLTEFSSKNTYNGEFKHGLRHGSGQQIINGIAFVGNFFEDVPCEDGSGIYVRLSDNAVISKPLT